MKIQNTKHYPLLIKNNGACTELISTGPELMQTHQLFKPVHWVMVNPLRPLLLDKPAICQNDIVLKGNYAIIVYVELFGRLGE